MFHISPSSSHGTRIFRSLVRRVPTVIGCLLFWPQFGGLARAIPRKNRRATVARSASTVYQRNAHRTEQLSFPRSRDEQGTLRPSIESDDLLLAVVVPVGLRYSLSPARENCRFYRRLENCSSLLSKEVLTEFLTEYHGRGERSRKVLGTLQ